MNKNIIIILIFIILSSIAQLSLMFGVDWMQYSRSDISDGQWWRFFTGNIVHLTWRHLMMNVLALIAIVVLYPKCLKLTEMVLVLVICCCIVTTGMWIFSPDIQWYVGLSGSLHGVLVTLIIVDYLSHKHWLNLLLLCALSAKLIWEGIMGPLPGSESAAGGPVVVQAHLYGFIGGLLISAYIIIKNNKLHR